MSLLTPERVPVKVYKWDDEGAPVLDKTPAGVGVVLKACLSTGYGSKQPAGWELTHEDAESNTKIFKVNSSITNSLLLRVYSYTKSETHVRLVTDVVSATSVTTVLKCDDSFKVSADDRTGEWMVIASDRAFWLFIGAVTGTRPAEKSGAFLFAGIVPGTQSDGFIIKHSGGTTRGANSITSTDSKYATRAALYNINTTTSATAWLDYMYDGMSDESPYAIASPLYFNGAGDIYQLPIYSPSRKDLSNFDTVFSDSQNMINFCTSLYTYDYGNNAYVPTDYWVY